MGGKDVHAGIIHKCSRIAGAYPQTYGHKGGSLRPLVRRGRVNPNNALERKMKRCACSARFAGTLLVRQNKTWGSLGHGRAPPAAVFGLYPRLTRKKCGIPPFDHCPTKLYILLFLSKIHTISSTYTLPVGNTPYRKRHNARTICITPLQSILEGLHSRQSVWVRLINQFDAFFNPKNA